MPKKKKIIKKAIKPVSVIESKEQKVFNILRKAAFAWDVEPRGTIEYGILSKLAKEITDLYAL